MERRPYSVSSSSTDVNSNKLFNSNFQRTGYPVSTEQLKNDRITASKQVNMLTVKKVNSLLTISIKNQIGQENCCLFAS